MPENEDKSEVFDFQLVCSLEELERQKRYALQLSGTGRKFAAFVDEMIVRTKRYEQKRLQNEKILVN